MSVSHCTFTCEEMANILKFLSIQCMSGIICYEVKEATNIIIHSYYKYISRNARHCAATLNEHHCYFERKGTKIHIHSSGWVHMHTLWEEQTC